MGVDETVMGELKWLAVAVTESWERTIIHRKKAKKKKRERETADGSSMAREKEGARTHQVSVPALVDRDQKIGEWFATSGIAQSGGLCFWPSRCPVNPLSTFLESWGRSLEDLRLLFVGRCNHCRPAVQGRPGLSRVARQVLPVTETALIGSDYHDFWTCSCPPILHAVLDADLEGPIFALAKPNHHQEDTPAFWSPRCRPWSLISPGWPWMALDANPYTVKEQSRPGPGFSIHTKVPV